MLLVTPERFSGKMGAVVFIHPQRQTVKTPNRACSILWFSYSSPVHQASSACPPALHTCCSSPHPFWPASCSSRCASLSHYQPVHLNPAPPPPPLLFPDCRASHSATVQRLLLFVNITWRSVLFSRVWHHDLLSGVCVWVLPSPVSLTVCRACELRFQAASSFDSCLHSIPHSCHGRADWRVSWGQNNRKEKRSPRGQGSTNWLIRLFHCFTCHSKRTTCVINIFINCCVQWVFTSSRVLVLYSISCLTVG